MIRLVNTATVVNRISLAFTRYEKEAYEIMKFHAAESMAHFAQVQTSAGPEGTGLFWTNHTMQAAEAYFAKAFQVPGRMGVTLAYNATPLYTKNLEEDYGGRFAALPYMLERSYDSIIRDLKHLYGG